LLKGPFAVLAGSARRTGETEMTVSASDTTVAAPLLKGGGVTIVGESESTRDGAAEMMVAPAS
jgi:hypothetical protein